MLCVLQMHVQITGVCLFFLGEWAVHRVRNMFPVSAEPIGASQADSRGAGWEWG